MYVKTDKRDSIQHKGSSFHERGVVASGEWTLTIVGLIHKYACRRSFQFLCPAHIVFLQTNY